MSILGGFVPNLGCYLARRIKKIPWSRLGGVDIHINIDTNINIDANIHIDTHININTIIIDHRKKHTNTQLSISLSWP